MLPSNRDTAIFDMRWRFDFLNRPSKYGKWSDPGTSPETQAWSQNKEGLIRASVEGKNRETFETKPLVECDGWDFVNFKWNACAIGPAFFKGTSPAVHRLLGMKLVTREKEFDVWPDGSIVEKIRDEADKKYNYATFGR